MKQFSMFVALAAASGGGVYSSRFWNRRTWLAQTPKLLHLGLLLIFFALDVLSSQYFEDFSI